MARIPAAVRRVELIEAALRVMTRDGVAAATTRAVCAEAGMPLATFHYCFRTRDEMLTELIGVVVGRELGAALGAIEPGSDLAATLRQALRGYLRHVESDPGAELVLFELNHWLLRNPELAPLAAAQYERYYAAAADVLTAAADLAGVRWRMPVPDLARLVITVLDGATTTWLADRQTALTQAALEPVVAMLVAQAESAEPALSS